MAAANPLFSAMQIGFTDAFGGFQFLLGEQFRTQLVPHVHPHYVIGVVDRGSVALTVRGQTWVATQGSVILLSPFEPHSEIPPTATGWSFRYLYPSEAVVRRALGVKSESDECLLRFARPVIAAEDLANRVGDVHLRVTLGQPCAQRDEAIASLFAILHQSYCADDAAGRRGRTRRRIDDARRFIIASAPRRVRVPDLARVAGLSEFHFNRVFREEVGLSVYAFFDRVRVARAHDLLFRGHSPSRVAHLLDYADQPHFTRHFMRASCFAPRQLAAFRGPAGSWTQEVAGQLHG